MFDLNSVYKEVRGKWFWPERRGKRLLTVCSNNISINDFSLNPLCFQLLGEAISSLRYAGFVSALY